MLWGQATPHRVLQARGLYDPVRIWAAGELSEEVLAKSVAGKLLLEKGDDFNFGVVGAGEVCKSGTVNAQPVSLLFCRLCLSPTSQRESVWPGQTLAAGRGQLAANQLPVRHTIIPLHKVKLPKRVAAEERMQWCCGRSNTWSTA